MRFSVLFAALVVAIALPARVEACFFTLIIDPLTVETTTFVDIPVLIDSGGFGDYDFEFQITTDASKLKVLDVVPGAGLQYYLQQHGVPTGFSLTCTPSTAYVNIYMSYGTPYYESSIHGEEFLILKCEVLATEPTSTNLYTSGMWVTGFSTPVTIIQPEEPFLRGDSNVDSLTDVMDAVSLISYIFGYGEDLECPDAGDVDDSGAVDIGDAIVLLNELFGPVQSLPLECGTDVTSDGLPDCVYESCP